MGPPPREDGQLPLVGKEFISLMAHTFFVYAVVRFDPVPESWPKWVSDAENQDRAGLAATAGLAIAKRRNLIIYGWQHRENT